METRRGVRNAGSEVREVFDHMHDEHAGETDTDFETACASQSYKDAIEDGLSIRKFAEGLLGDLNQHLSEDPDDLDDDDLLRLDSSYGEYEEDEDLL